MRMKKAVAAAVVGVALVGGAGRSPAWGLGDPKVDALIVPSPGALWSHIDDSALQPLVSGLAGHMNSAGATPPVTAAEAWENASARAVLIVDVIEFSSDAQRDANLTGNDARSVCEGTPSSSNIQTLPAPLGTASSEATCTETDAGRSVAVQVIVAGRGDFEALILGFDTAPGFVTSIAGEQQQRLPAPAPGSTAPESAQSGSAAYAAGRIFGLVLLIAVIVAVPIVVIRARTPKRVDARVTPVPFSPVPPGWYEDPQRLHRMRWWDGNVWTADTID